MSYFLKRRIRINISSQNVVETGIVPIMQNAYDKVIMRIPLPTISPTTFVFSEHFTSSANITTTYENDKGLRIKDIEILLKESNGISVKLVDTINIDAAKNESTSPFSIYTITPKPGSTRYRQAIEYTYKAKEPFKVLPEKQLIRVSDDVPVRAKAQEIVGNRVVYGNKYVSHMLYNGSNSIQELNDALDQVYASNEFKSFNRNN